MSAQEINALLERVPTDDHSQRAAFELLASYRRRGLELARLGLTAELVAVIRGELREELADALTWLIEAASTNPIAVVGPG